MTRTEVWLTGFAVVGAVAGVVAGWLFWMVVANPIALAETLGGLR